MARKFNNNGELYLYQSLAKNDNVRIFTQGISFDSTPYADNENIGATAIIDMKTPPGLKQLLRDLYLYVHGDFTPNAYIIITNQIPPSPGDHNVFTPQVKDFQTIAQIKSTDYLVIAGATGQEVNVIKLENLDVLLEPIDSNDELYITLVSVGNNGATTPGTIEYGVVITQILH